MSLPLTVEIERYQDVLPAVMVDVGGLERRFLLDTGAGITCITPTVAEQLGVTPYGKLVGLRMTGQKVTLQQVDGVEVGVGGVRLAPPTVGVLDLGSLLPDSWPPVAGVLALDAFVAQPLTIDLSGRALVLESDESLAARHATGDDLEIRVSRPLQGLAREVFVAARLQERTLWLELDSGNAGAVLLGEHIGIEDDGEIELDVGADAPWTGEFHVHGLILDGNLGQTFFAGRAITLDLAAERMTVTPS